MGDVAGPSGGVTWPLHPEQASVVAQLAERIRQSGSARFLRTRVVRADLEDFPDRWSETASALHTLLYRLAWHAHLDVEIALDDPRRPAPPETKALRTSELALVATRGGTATFEVTNLGNDDIAGLAANEIGRMYARLSETPSLRDAASEESVSDGDASIAATYLGLGVLVANASAYRRHVERRPGQTTHRDEFIAEVGGLSISDATMILAIQDAVRDDATEAYDTLLPPQREWFEAWHAVFEGHDGELRDMLALDDSGELPAQAAAPRQPPEHTELAVAKPNRGRLTFRVPTSKQAANVVLGLLVGGAVGALIATLWLLPILVVAGGLVGAIVPRNRYRCSEPECRARLSSSDEECPHCGGRIADTIADERLRLERREDIEREQLEVGSDADELGDGAVVSQSASDLVLDEQRHS